MTGFGKANGCINNKNIYVNIKSVNSRYLDISFKLSSNCKCFENDIRLLLKSYIFRGKVEVEIREIVDNMQYFNNVVCNKQLLDRYIKNLYEISKEHSLAFNISTDTVARLPGVFCFSENSSVSFEWDDVKPIVENALKDFLNSRRLEGKRTCEDIFNNILFLEELISKIKEQLPYMLDEYKKRLSKKLEKLLESYDINDARLTMEIALFTDKTDVSEELTRLDSHIISLKKLLKGDFDVGRKCDFIVQEINREINTVGSKTKSIRISEAVIESKTFVEKIREQIQNLE